MKKIALYSATLLLSALLFSCGITRRMEARKPLQTIPDSLFLIVNQQADPNTVNVSYALQVPPRYVPRKAQVVYETFLVNGTNRQAVSKIYLNGRTYERLMWRQARFEHAVPDYSDGIMVVSGKEPLTVTTNTNVVFQEWMPAAALVAETSVKLCEAVYPVGRKVLARGVEYIPLEPGPVIIAPVAEPVKVEPVIRKAEGSASLSYPVNGYRIDAAFGNNASELDRMTSLLNKILKDSLYSTERIVVTGICSPDGPYNYNQDLAKNRAAAVKDYLVTRLGVDPDLIHTDYVAEDWDGLRQMVELSSIADKQGILSIIDGTLGPEAKEAALRKLPQYSAIRSQMLPRLRRVKYEIFYTEKLWPNNP